MIRDTPCHFFTKYLLSHPSRYSNEGVRKKLQKLHLDYVGSDHLDGLREEMSIPDPFYPEQTSHLSSWKFLLKEKVYRLHHKDDATENAFLILRTPRAKEMAETFLLSGVPYNHVASQMTMKLRIAFSAAGVERYYFYFWNLARVDSMEIRAILALRHNGALRRVGAVEVNDGMSDEMKHQLLTTMMEKTVMSEAMSKTVKYKDPRFAALAIAASPAAAMLSQARLGIMPKKEDITKSLALARDFAAMRVIENAFDGGPHNALAAMQWSATVKATTDVLDSMQKPSEDLFDHLKKAKLKNKKFDAPLLGKDGNDYSRGYALADRVDEMKKEVVDTDGHEVTDRPQNVQK